MILRPPCKFVCVHQKSSGEGYDHDLKEGECWMGTGEKKALVLGQSFSFVLIIQRLPRWSSAGLKLGFLNHPEKGGSQNPLRNVLSHVSREGVINEFSVQ